MEWKVCADSKEQDSNSLYFQKSRSHVISFNEIYIESPKLELPGGSNDSTNINSNRAAASTDEESQSSFSFSFCETGRFTYQCAIYTRMKGCIEVINDEEFDCFAEIGVPESYDTSETRQKVQKSSQYSSTYQKYANLKENPDSDNSPPDFYRGASDFQEDAQTSIFNYYGRGGLEIIDEEQ